MTKPTKKSFPGAEPRKATTVEDIYDQIGGFGLVQVIITSLLFSAKFVWGWSMMHMTFAGFVNDYVCITDSEQGHTGAGGAYGNVSSAAETNVATNETFINVCSVNGTDCQDFRFLGERRTAISEWKLVCSLQWMKATITSVQMAGVGLGAFLGGMSGDYFGRKKTHFGSLLVHAVANIIAAYSVSWQMFAAMRFFIGVLMGSGMVMVVPYPTEFLPTRWRHVIPGLPIWPLGIMAFATAAWWRQDHTDLQIMCAIISVLFMVGVVYAPESPRWLATQNRLDESYAVLEKMARTNGKTLPPDTMDVLKHIAADEKSSHSAKKYTYLDLFKDRRSRRITLIFAFQWFSMSIIYYGISFAVSSLVGNLYINIFIMSTIQVPAYLSIMFLVDWIGRRPTCMSSLSVAMLVSFTCLGLHVAGSDEYRDAVISPLCLVATLMVVAAWAASQIWVTESYPTVTRSLGYGFANICSRLGSIIAPFVINLDQLPTFTYILMGTLTLAAIVLTYFIPETYKTIMGETMHKDSVHATKDDNDLTCAYASDKMAPLDSEEKVFFNGTTKSDHATERLKHNTDEHSHMV